MKVLKNYPPKLTQGYKDSHKANDIVGSNNGKSVLDTLVAMDDGVVEQVINNVNINTSGESKYGSTKKDSSNGGNTVKIRYSNGYVSRYLHGKYNSVKVKVGDKVKAGQAVMEMGNTGYSFGGHLHLDLWLNGNRVDPYDYVFKDKTFNNLPKPVDRDETIEQLQVVEKQLRVRTGHSTKDTVLGFCTTGIYNILYKYKDDTYTWYEIEKDCWVASEGTWAVILEPKKEEPEQVENKPVEEQKQEDSTNTLPSNETSEKQENKQDIADYYEKENNGLLWFINLIVDFIKKIFTYKG